MLTKFATLVAQFYIYPAYYENRIHLHKQWTKRNLPQVRRLFKSFFTQSNILKSTRIVWKHYIYFNLQIIKLFGNKYVKQSSWNVYQCTSSAKALQNLLVTTSLIDKTNFHTFQVTSFILFYCTPISWLYQWLIQLNKYHYMPKLYSYCRFWIRYLFVIYLNHKNNN